MLNCIDSFNRGWSVGPSVDRSVCPSVRRSVGAKLTGMLKGDGPGFRYMYICMYIFIVNDQNKRSRTSHVFTKQVFLWA